MWHSTHNDDWSSVGSSASGATGHQPHTKRFQKPNIDPMVQTRFNWSIGSTEDHSPDHVRFDLASDWADWTGLARCTRSFIWTSLFSLTAAAASGSDDVHIAHPGKLTGPFGRANCSDKFDSLLRWGQLGVGSTTARVVGVGAASSTPVAPARYPPRSWLGFP